MMRFTRTAIMALSIFAVAILITPQYALAVEYSQQRIDLEFDSENASRYDEVVNLADESAIQNPDTWQPAPSGIWIGSSTEESLFEFDDVTYDGSKLLLSSTVRFNSTQIMNGASDFIVRSPIDSRGLTDLRLTIYSLDSTSYYFSRTDVSGDTTTYSHVDGDFTLRIPETSSLGDVEEIDLSDSSITDGDCSWTLDNRTYVRVRGPIYTSVDYLFIWKATYEADERFKIYLAPQDVANDNITSTSVYRYVERSAVDYTFVNQSLAIDPGISFDFLNGMSNGICGVTEYMEVGDSITFGLETITAGTYYQTLMVPFTTDDGDLYASVVAYDIFDTILWTNTTIWDNYIFACSDSTVPSPGFASIRITVHEAGNVTWIMRDLPYTVSASLADKMFVNTTSGIKCIHAAPWASYQMSIAHVYAPSVDPADFPAAMLDQVREPATYYGAIIGVLMVATGGLLCLTGVGVTAGVIMMGAGTAMIVADLVKGGTLIDGDSIPGVFRNALDAVRDALESAGKFIWSVGEAIFDGLTWLADQMVEYGTYLLGLVIVAVALFIFFKAIDWQLGAYRTFLALAKGDKEGAQKAASTITDDVERVAGGLR